jgi:hypothetical protein
MNRDFEQVPAFRARESTAMQVQRGPAITDTALEMRHKQELDRSFSFNVTLRQFLQAKSSRLN